LAPLFASVLLFPGIWPQYAPRCYRRLAVFPPATVSVATRFGFPNSG